MPDNMNFKNLHIIILFVSSLAFPLSAAGQIKAARVSIAPLNRATIYFSKLPDKFTSSLSEDKRKINIKAINSGVEETARVTRGEGVIDEVYIQTIDANLDISISLKDKRGYTVAPLPYSNALMVEAFVWERLSPAEDNYRNALLALESGVARTAIRYFTKSSKLGNDQAAAMLAIQLLKTGDVNLAYEYALMAVRANTNIADSYACLAQIYKMRSDMEKSKQYAGIFFQMTGLKSFPELSVGTVEFVDSIPSGPVSLLKMMNDPFYGDSTFFNDTSSIADTAGFAKDTLISEIPDSLSRTAESKTDDMPEWFKYLIIFAVVTVIGLGLIVAMLYLKWRNSQMKSLKKAKPKSKEKTKTQQPEKQQSSLPSASLAAKAYTKQQQSATTTINTDVKLTQSTERSLKEREKLPEELTAEDPAIKKEEQQELERILSKFRKQAEIDLNKEEEQKKTRFEETENFQTTQKPALPAKVELALHLAQEQQKLKRKNIENLDKEKLPTDVNKLADVAKKLGIEKSSLETKKSLEKMQSDKQSLNKLFEKFSSKDDDSSDK